MNLMNVKGTFDYANKEQFIREYIKDTLKELFKEYGYLPLETPIICNYDLLALKYEEGDEILNEVYKLKDQGDRKLALRYDLTVPFAKYIAMTKDISLPFKRYEIGDAFRDGPVKVGRNRQFVQCDVDVVGLSGEMIEAEIIDLFIKGIKKFKINPTVKYNNRKIMSGLLEVIGIPEKQVSSVIKIIDKIEKISEEELIQELSILGIKKEEQELIFKYFTYSFSEIAESFLTTDNIKLQEGIKEAQNLEDYLKALDLLSYAKFSPTLARGQEYYTGNVFEVYALESKIKSSIGGGGRYDKIITEFINDGKDYPAVGISFGLNVIYEIIKDDEEFNPGMVDIYIIPMGYEKECLILANKIRDLKLKTLVEMQNKKIKKCFEYANRENIPYVIVIGENEIKEQSFKLKNMATGEEALIEIKDINKIKDIILVNMLK